MAHTKASVLNRHGEGAAAAREGLHSTRLHFLDVLLKPQYFRAAANSSVHFDPSVNMTDFFFFLSLTKAPKCCICSDLNFDPVIICLFALYVTYMTH